MATRTTQVFLHNDTPFWLTTPIPALVHGVWGREGAQAPPETIAPHTVGEMGSDSGGDIPLFGSIATGTEGEVTYRIEDGKDSFVSIHWDNPFKAHDFRGNTYREIVSRGFALTHSDGSGNHAVVHFYLAIPSSHRIPHFLPSTSGFLFGNHWDPLPVIELPPPFGTVVTSAHGMCGGMTFAVRDYYEAGQIPPATENAPSQESDPLFQFIRKRLIDSWDVAGSGLNFILYMSPACADGDLSFAMVENAWPEIRAHLDAGELTPIGLVRVKSLDLSKLGRNHQVLVYGYEVDGANVILNVYDPNHPNKDTVKLTFNKERADVPIVVSYTIDGDEDQKPIYCFFLLNYESVVPPLGRTRGSSPYNVSLKDFFSSTGFDPSKGLRAVQPESPSISVKSLVGL